MGGNSTFLGITSYSEPRSTRYGLDSDAAWLYHEGVHLNPTSDLLCAWATQYRSDNGNKDCGLYLDFDMYDKQGQPTGKSHPCDPQDIIEALREQGYPTPTYYIDSTTPGCFHMFFAYSKPLERRSRGYWYKLMGADTSFTNSLMKNPCAGANANKVTWWNSWSDQESIPTIDSPEDLIGFVSPANVEMASLRELLRSQGGEDPIGVCVEEVGKSGKIVLDNSEEKPLLEPEEFVAEPSTSVTRSFVEVSFEEEVKKRISATGYPNPEFRFYSPEYQRWRDMPISQMEDKCGRHKLLKSAACSVYYEALYTHGEELSREAVLRSVSLLSAEMKQPLTVSDLEFVVDQATTTFMENHEHWYNSSMKGVVASQAHRIRLTVNKLTLLACFATLRAEITAVLTGKPSDLRESHKEALFEYLSELSPNNRSGIREARARAGTLAPVLATNAKYKHDKKWLENGTSRAALHLADPANVRLPEVSVDKAIHILSLVSQARHVNKESSQDIKSCYVWDYIQDPEVNETTKKMVEFLLPEVTARSDHGLRTFVNVGGNSRNDKIRRQKMVRKYHVTEKLAIGVGLC